MKTILTLLWLTALAVTAGASDGTTATTTTVQTVGASWSQLATPFVVPILLMILKLAIPRIPKAFIPCLAPVLGGAIDFVTTQSFGQSTGIGAVLGMSGVWLREVVDQAKKANVPGFTVLTLGVMISLSTIGCKNLDATAYKTLSTTEGAVDCAMQAWGGYVTNKRADLITAPDADAKAKLREQEETVKKAYTTYRNAVNAVYIARKAYLADKAAGKDELTAKLDALAAASSDLLAAALVWVQTTSTK